MHLIQIFLPISAAGARSVLPALRDELTTRFGGVTIYARSPAKGSWVDEEDGHREEDDVVVVEVMTDRIDQAWWANCRTSLEQQLSQDEILIRAIVCEKL